MLLRWLDECLEELGFEIRRCWGPPVSPGRARSPGCEWPATAGGLVDVVDVPVWTVDALRPCLTIRQITRSRGVGCPQGACLRRWYHDGVQVTEVEDVSPAAVTCPWEGNRA